VVPKPADSRPAAARGGFGAKSPAAPPVTTLHGFGDLNDPVAPMVVERTSPVPEPASPAPPVEAFDLPIVGAPIVSVEPSPETELADPPTIDMPTQQLPHVPREAFEATAAPSVEQMLADVPPPPAPSSPRALPALEAEAPATPGPFAPVAQPAAPVEAEPAPAEPPPSFAVDDSTSKFADEPVPQPGKRKSSLLPLLLVAVLVLAGGTGAFLYIRSPEQKPPQPFQGATEETSKPTATAAVTATATSTAIDTAAPADPSGTALTSAAVPALTTPKDPTSLPKNVGYLIVNAPEPGQLLWKGKMIGDTGTPIEMPCGNQSYSFGKKLPNGGMQMGRAKTTNVLCQKVTTIDLTVLEITPPPPAPPGGGGQPPGGVPPGGTPPGGTPPVTPPGGGDPYEPSAP